MYVHVSIYVYTYVFFIFVYSLLFITDFSSFPLSLPWRLSSVLNNHCMFLSFSYFPPRIFFDSCQTETSLNLFYAKLMSIRSSTFKALKLVPNITNYLIKLETFCSKFWSSTRVLMKCFRWCWKTHQREKG